MSLPQPPDDLIRESLKPSVAASVALWQAGYAAGVKAERARIFHATTNAETFESSTMVGSAPMAFTGAATVESRPVSEAGVQAGKRAPRGSVQIVIKHALAGGAASSVEDMDKLGAMIGRPVSPHSISNQLRFWEKDGKVRKTADGRWQTVEGADM